MESKEKLDGLVHGLIMKHRKVMSACVDCTPTLLGLTICALDLTVGVATSLQQKLFLLRELRGVYMY